MRVSLRSRGLGVVVDDDRLRIGLHPARRVGRARIHHKGARHPSARQVVGVDKAEMVVIEGQELAHVAVHQARQHGVGVGKDQRRRQQRSQGVEIRAFMGNDNIKRAIHVTLCPD